MDRRPFPACDVPCGVLGVAGPGTYHLAEGAPHDLAWPMRLRRSRDVELEGVRRDRALVRSDIGIEDGEIIGNNEQKQLIFCIDWPQMLLYTIEPQYKGVNDCTVKSVLTSLHWPDIEADELFSLVQRRVSE